VDAKIHFLSRGLAIELKFADELLKRLQIFDLHPTAEGFGLNDHLLLSFYFTPGSRAF
jgi:hypothetical protein